ncbi:MAG: FHA domain-containing protein [Trebonia sp.]
MNLTERMSVTECVPLAGRGLVARRGGLVVLSDGLDPGPDPLLAALDEVADSGGDGAALLRAAASAALKRGGRPAWACAGVTFDGEVAVLAHGEAAALVSVDGGPETKVTAGGSVVPIALTVAGAVVAVRLVIGAAAAPDPRLRLDAGTVLGGGVKLTVTQEKSHTPVPNGPYATVVPTTLPSMEPPRIPAGPDAESWFRAARPSRPAMRVTQTDGATTYGPPAAPIADISTMRLEQLGVVEPVVVDGALCARMHFNAPDAMFCRECRVSMREGAKNTRSQPRPPLGVLLVDDGRGYPLDRDYVIGREPLLDGDVAAGRAAPLPVTDPEGSVSRLHLRVSLVGWRVEVRDLGSANGSVLYRAGGPRALAPADVVALDPGARVGVGRRSVQFLPYGVSPHSATLDGATT